MNTHMKLTVQDAIDTLLRQVPVALHPGTVDTLKTGNPAQTVRGIAVTFMATCDVLRRAAELGANFVVTHEPTFYNHLDETNWLEADAVYRAKRRLIDDHSLAVWRFHDGPHLFDLDGIVTGMVRKLGWTQDDDATRAQIFTVPAQSVRELAQACKQRLGIAQVRVAGDPDAVCTRVALRVGASGGRGQIERLQHTGVDVVVCGESPEWETCEYVRDAAALGQGKALIVLGHANSEEAGMEWLAEWMRPLFPADVPVHYVPAGDPFRFV